MMAPGGWGQEAKAPPTASALPDSIRSTLTREYPGWKLAPVTPEIQKAYRQHNAPHPPSITTGDFDHDGRRDYVVQIVLKSSGEEEQIIIAFLARPDGYEEDILQSMGIDASYSLWTMKASLDETGTNPDKAVAKDVVLVLGGRVFLR
jgi:hypothetical protein